jgi:hypothetical protein
MPVETKHFFRGAACAMALSTFCWAALGGAAYFGLALYQTKGTTSFARTMIQITGSMRRLGMGTRRVSIEPCPHWREWHGFISL